MQNIILSDLNDTKNNLSDLLDFCQSKYNLITNDNESGTKPDTLSDKIQV